MNSQTKLTTKFRFYNRQLQTFHVLEKVNKNVYLSIFFSFSFFSPTAGKPLSRTLTRMSAAGFWIVQVQRVLIPISFCVHVGFWALHVSFWRFGCTQLVITFPLNQGTPTSESQTSTGPRVDWYQARDREKCIR